MLYFQIINNEVHAVAAQLTAEQHADRTWQCRADWCDYPTSLIHHLANSATRLGEDRYIVADSGPYCHPRYDIIRAPKVGDLVSYGFNGDYYPDGEIVRVSASLMVVTTSTGRKYYRRGLTGTWKWSGTWSLVAGHHSRLNPEF